MDRDVYDSKQKLFLIQFCGSNYKCIINLNLPNELNIYK